MVPKGHALVISGVTQSGASRSFDRNGDASAKINFEKIYVQNWMEYGLTDAFTIFVAPEYVSAVSEVSGQPAVRAHALAIEGGARLLLSSRFGKVSLQASGKSAGAFDMSVSVGRASGSQFELRLLYGNSFTLLRRSAFIDFEVAERWITRPRPNEMTIDVMAGIWIRPKAMIMVQSFNTISGGAGKPPYTFYRQHKIELSFVRKIGPHWSLQVGGFVSPLGQSIVAEQGVVTALWYRF
ncbi:MAG: hypothetical protein KGJ78_15705 [Alphaproteobacteria bacterium]|nr:hypothetical protein [Alphaproteobacteria bacterium]